jgi:hypothetical protein
VARVDDKNTVRCECGSGAFEPLADEHKVWELLPIKQDDGTVLHKSVCVTDVVIRLCCSACGKEIVGKPEPVVLSERPSPALPEKSSKTSDKN